ncbi:ABC transporter permease [Kroppenstedtia eburnea]|uniref:ABC transporter permease n=1 Tax=Kroppenstedtia eburnea TaxID=714067 RepID=UPI00363F7C87
MFLAVRELKHSKLRFLLIGLIMILITCLVFIISGLAEGLSADNGSSIQNMNADALVLQSDVDKRLDRSVLSEKKLDEIRDLGIDAVPLGQKMASAIREGTDRKMDATFFATWAESFLVPPVVEGKSLDPDRPDGVLVDEKLKREEGLRLHDVLQDEVSGEKLRVIGFTSGQTFSHTPVIYVTTQKWAKIQPSGASNLYNGVAVRGKADAVKKIETSVDGVEAVSKEEALKSIPSYQAEQTSLNMMIAFLFVIAAFVLAVFFYVITLQKTQQFGVLKALGANTGYLAGNLIGQVILIAAVSIAVGVGGTFAMNALFPAGIPFALDTGMILQYSALLLGVAVAGSLLSLVRVAKVDAMEAIGRVD